MFEAAAAAATVGGEDASTPHRSPPPPLPNAWASRRGALAKPRGSGLPHSAGGSPLPQRGQLTCRVHPANANTGFEGGLAAGQQPRARGGPGSPQEVMPPPPPPPRKDVQGDASPMAVCPSGFEVGRAEGHLLAGAGGRSTLPPV